MKFFTSDLHFNHANVLSLSNRPFNDVEHMNYWLIENWNSKVKKNDEVFLLGDLGWTSPMLADQIGALNGHIHLIKGNHDKKISGEVKKKFVSISDIKETNVFFDGKSHRIIMCHYPMIEWNGWFRGSLHAFGHCHGLLDKNMWKPGTRRHDVGVDVNNYTPLSEVELLNILLNKEKK